MVPPEKPATRNKFFWRKSFQISAIFDNQEEEQTAYKICFDHLCNKMGAPHESRKDKSDIVAGLIPLYDLSIVGKKK